MNTFTPFNNKDIENLNVLPTEDEYEFVGMEIDDDDMQKIGRGRDWSAEITDQLTGRRFEVAGAPCNLSTCFCAAKIVRELT